MTFDDDEIETIRKLIRDRGFDYGLESDGDKVARLAKKIGMSLDMLRRPI